MSCYEAFTREILERAAHDNRAQPWKSSANIQASAPADEWVEISKPTDMVTILENAFPMGPIDIRENAFPIGDVNVFADAFPPAKNS